MHNNNFIPPQPISMPHKVGILPKLTGLILLVALGTGVGLYVLGTNMLMNKVEAAGEKLAKSRAVFENAGVVEKNEIIAPAVIEEPPPPPLPVILHENPFPADQYTARSIVVRDVASGMILVEKNSYEPRPIASITKLMSALVMLERNPSWTATTTVVEGELIDTHMYSGDTYTYDELWVSGLVASSNKAIMSLSDAIGWNRSAFIERMNQKSKEIGMEEAGFAEPTGLDEANYATAVDVAALLREALDHEDINRAVNTNEITLYSAERGKSHHMWNTNWLQLGWIPSDLKVVGGKTGYIQASGYNLAVRLENEQGVQLDVIILGAEKHEDRFTEARDSALWAFNNFAWPNEKKEEENSTEDS